LGVSENSLAVLKVINRWDVSTVALSPAEKAIGEADTNVKTATKVQRGFVNRDEVTKDLLTLYSTPLGRDSLHQVKNLQEVSWKAQKSLGLTQSRFLLDGNPGQKERNSRRPGPQPRPPGPDLGWQVPHLVSGPAADAL
jgi:hypothetical protein